ncbi:hypothetical protein [Cyclobacterium plantarum]|uniref:hypothetical protein n=1 Tax=Cyclobacterium plantarum TaxID=2716263 RepID=UPI003F7254DD
MKLVKIIILCPLIFILFGCKEFPILLEFESDTDKLIREYTDSVDNKKFYVYSTDEKDVYIIDYFEKNVSVNIDKGLGYWKLSNGVKITILPEDVVEDIQSKLLLDGKLKTGGILVVKFHSNGKIDVVKGQ